jgi:hypothetical protein
MARYGSGSPQDVRAATNARKAHNKQQPGHLMINPKNGGPAVASADPALAVKFQLLSDHPPGDNRSSPKQLRLKADAAFSRP